MRVKRHTLCWIFFFLSACLQGQALDSDSLAILLDGLPPYQKRAAFAQMEERFRRTPRLPAKIALAQALKTYAEARNDTVFLQYSLELLEAAALAAGEKEQASRYRLSRYVFASVYGWHVDEDYFEENAYYGYRFTRLEAPLWILEDPGGEYDHHAVAQGPMASRFTSNFVRQAGFNPRSVYWVRLRLVGSQYEDGEYYFFPACGYSLEGRAYSWDTVRVWARRAAGDTLLGFSGDALRPSEKPIRDRYNFFAVPLRRGESVELLLRLAGGPQAPIPSAGLYLEFIDQNTLLEFDGFRPLPLFPRFDAHGDLRYNPIERSLEVVEDSSGMLAFAEVYSAWDSLSRMNQAPARAGVGAYWVRLRLLGDDKHYGNLLLEAPPRPSWDKVDVYWPDEQRRYVRQWMGRTTPVGERPLPHWRHLFHYRLAADQSAELFFRLEGRAAPADESLIQFRHIEESSFWPILPYRSYLNGLLFGGIAFQLALFILFFSLRAQAFLGYYILFLTGLLLLALFKENPEHGAFLLPRFSNWFGRLAILGQFLLVWGWVRYSVSLLSDASVGKWLAPAVHMFTGVWLLLVGVRYIDMFSSVALPSLLSEWLPFMLLGWSLFGVLGTLALGLGRSGKVDESVYCYWIAAAIALVFGVLAAGYYWAHGDLYGDLYAIVLLLVGALFTLLFLAVGNVYAFNARGK
jgi:hypothetical protein